MGQKKKKSKKSVTFCDQVVLVATAEDEEEDAYIPNPILERVLKSALTSSLSDTDSSSCGESVCSRASSQSQIKSNVPTPQASPHYHSTQQPFPQGYSNQPGHLQTHHAQPLAQQSFPTQNPTLQQPHSNSSYPSQGLPTSVPTHPNHTHSLHNHQPLAQQYSQPPQSNGSVRLPPPYQPPPSVSHHQSVSKAMGPHSQSNQVSHTQGQSRPLTNGLHPSQMPHLIPGQQPSRSVSQQRHIPNQQPPSQHYQQQQQQQQQTQRPSVVPYPGMIRQNSSLGFQHHTETERTYPPYQRVPHPNHSQGQTQSHTQVHHQKMHPQVHQPHTSVVNGQPNSYNGYGGPYNMQQSPSIHGHPHQQQQHGSGYGSVGRGGVKGTPSHFCGPLDPTAIYSTVNKVTKKPAGAPQLCNLCRQKCITPPCTYCNDCEFYMSRFKPKI